MTGTAVARTSPLEGISRILDTENARLQIEPLIPSGVSYKRVLSEIAQVVTENPAILEATPQSIVMAVGKGLSWGLVFGETVHLVPFDVKVSKKNENPPRFEKRVKAIRDYKGTIEMVMSTGVARYIDAQCVYENERFEYEQGTAPFIKHVPILDPAKRGKLIGGYGVAKLAHYQVKIVWMPVEEIDKIRREKSKSWYTRWEDGQKVIIPLSDLEWYVKKTCCHQVCKALPKNPKLAALLTKFDDEEAEEVEAEAVSVNAVSTDHGAMQQPELPAAPASTETVANGGATPDQIERILDLVSDERVPSDRKERIEEKLAKGISSAAAKTWIDLLEKELNITSVAQEEEAGELLPA